MRINRYMVAVLTLALLAIAFGIFGTVAPPSTNEPQPQQTSDSDSVGHFQNPPTYDSGWINISDKLGKSFSLTHNLNSTDAVVDVVGRRSSTGKEHKLLFGAAVKIGFSETYGRGTDSPHARASLVQTRDGGYTLLSESLFVKTDDFGDTQWSKTPGSGCMRSLVQTSDEGYAIAGFIDSEAPGYLDFWLVKTDSAGAVQWNKTYGGEKSDLANSLLQTSDGGYAIAGDTYNSTASCQQAYFVKTDALGNMEWNKTYWGWGGSSTPSIYSLVQTSDEGYVLAGVTVGGFVGGYDFGLIKTDSAGNMQWNKTYGGTDREEAFSVVKTIDGGYALVGYISSFTNPGDFWLVKTDSAGSMEWNKTYGGTNTDIAFSLVQTNDGGYAMAGLTDSFGLGFQAYLVKTDSSGNMEWQRTYGGTEKEEGHSLVQTSDGGYAIAGYTRSYGPPGGQLWLVKTDSGGVLEQLGYTYGLSMTEFTDSTVAFYRGSADLYWNYVRVRIWLVKEPNWIYGDINMDGIVNGKDLYTIGRNYGHTFSALSLGGLVAVAGVHSIKKRKRTS